MSKEAENETRLVKGGSYVGPALLEHLADHPCPAWDIPGCVEALRASVSFYADEDGDHYELFLSQLPLHRRNDGSGSLTELQFHPTRNEARAVCGPGEVALNHVVGVVVGAQGVEIRSRTPNSASILVVSALGGLELQVSGPGSGAQFVLTLT